MYLHTPDYIYLTYFNDEIIILDLLKNQYIFLPKKLSRILEFALKNNFNNKKHYSKRFNEAIQYLIKKNILLPNYYEYPCEKQAQKKQFSAGASNINWNMEYENFHKRISKKLIIEAYFTLLKVYLILKRKGFYQLIIFIKKRAKENTTFFKNEASEFKLLAEALDKACFYFPWRTKCLEWAAALTLMGLKRKWQCNLEIGVQNMPFAAHAWVKACNGIVADQPKLPEQLSIILSEPLENSAPTWVVRRGGNDK